jgi:hypothetical protein
LGQKGKLFIMLQTMSIQILVNFGQRKSHQIELQSLCWFWNFRKRIVAGPACQQPTSAHSRVSRPTRTRERSGDMVTARHLTPARSAARHASSTRRTCSPRAVCPYPALPRSQEKHPLPPLLMPAHCFLPPARLAVHLCHAAAPRAPTPAIAGRATPRQPRAPPKLGPPLRTVDHRSELTTSH